jgi:hypothetical protein
MADERVTTWLSEQRVDGRIAVRIGRRGQDLVAEFANVGLFVADSSGTRTHVEPSEGVSPAVVEKLGASAIDALIRHARGKLTFHGSAVSSGSTAAALLGPSGAGKSTLAAALCAQAGLALVADDTVSLELPADATSETPAEVRSTQTAAWLLPSARAALGLDPQAPGKVPVDFPASSSASLSLALVVGLVFDPKATKSTIRRLRGHDAFVLLASSAIRFVIDRPDAQLREFEQLRSLAQRCPIFELRRPRQLDQLQRSVELIRQGLLRTPAEGTVR